MSPGTPYRHQRAVVGVYKGIPGDGDGNSGKLHTQRRLTIVGERRAVGRYVPDQKWREAERMGETGYVAVSDDDDTNVTMIENLRPPPPW